MSSTCSIQDYPFAYFDANNEFVNGTLVGDSCIFPDAYCSPGVPTKDCCYINQDLWPGTGESYMYIALIFVYGPMYWGIYALMNSMTEQEKKEWEEEEEKLKPRWITGSKCLPNFLKKIFLNIWSWGITCWVIAQIVIGINLKQSEQANMTVTERNSLAAAEAFMVPFYTIFTFVEDIILIRVSYAMAAEDKGQTDRLIHMGLAGVIVTGSLAGVVGTLLGVFETSLAFLTIPGLENDKQLYPGCEFIESVDISTILPYWLTQSWGSLGQQIGGVLSGYLMGGMEYPLFGWVGLIGLGVFSYIWFGNVRTYPNPMTLLGVAEFVKNWTIPILFIVFIKSPMGAQLRERTGLELSFKKVFSYFAMPFRRKEESSKNSEELRADKDRREKELKNLVKQGLKLMFIEMTLQLCISVSMHFSLKADGSVAYQMTALQSYLPIYGVAYTFGMAMIIKTFGPLLLGEGHGIFLGFVKWNVVALLGLVILIFGSTWSFRDGLAIGSGTNACAYASSEECLPYFERVFGENGEGGIFTLPFTYYIFPFASSIESCVMVIRSILLTLLDFDFMMKASFVAGIFFIPAISVVQLAGLDSQQEAIAYFLAMYVPQLVLLIMCLVRLVIVMGMLRRGENGPWSPKEESLKKIRKSVMAEKAIATVNAEISAADYSNKSEVEINA